MYGDTSALRRRVAQLQLCADEVRDRARLLVQQAESMEWASAAGDALRGQIRVSAHALGIQATLLDTAAECLAKHIRAVEALKEAIFVAQQAALSLWDRVTEFVANGAEVPRLFAVPPPLGSKDWLDIRNDFARRGWAP